MGPRMIHQAGEMPHLGSQHRPAVERQPVVAPLRGLAVLRRFGGGRFLDVSGIFQPLDRLVERSGAETDLALGPFFDGLFDGVTVARAVGEGQQDVNDREGHRVAELYPAARGHNVSLDDMSRPKVCSSSVLNTFKRPSVTITDAPAGWESGSREWHMGSIDRRPFLKMLSAAAVTTVVGGARSLAEAQGRGGPLRGLIYYVDFQNRLLWNRHDGRADGSFRWAEPTNRQVGTGWDFKHVFSGGDGVIYYIDSQNRLMWNRHDGRADGSFRWAEPTNRQVGTGWDFKHVFSGGDGLIYYVDGQNRLLWNRHDGRADGSFRWAEPTNRQVGTGWDFKHVFSGGDGVIYYIDGQNRLLWNRHDGRADGSFRWAEPTNRQVGTGWDFKHVFSGGDGVIYYVDGQNRLLWNRHDGRADGSFRWAEPTNRQVGTGWDFKHVFAD